MLKMYAYLKSNIYSFLLKNVNYYYYYYIAVITIIVVLVVAIVIIIIRKFYILFKFQISNF